MKNTLLLLILLIAPISASAFQQTDYQCVNQCTSAGNQYGLCVARCSWDNSQQQQQQQEPTYQAPKIKQTDYQCVSNCTNKGYQYGLCVDRCSY